MPDLDVHYMLMFLLSHIARYKTSLYKEIIESGKRTEIITLMEKTLEVSENKFPKLILDQLLEQYFLFSG
jgi:hypothetical protein